MLTVTRLPAACREVFGFPHEGEDMWIVENEGALPVVALLGSLQLAVGFTFRDAHFFGDFF